MTRSIVRRLAPAVTALALALAASPVRAGHNEPLTSAAQLPAIGALSGSATPNANSAVSPVVDSYGRVSGYLQNAISGLLPNGAVANTTTSAASTNTTLPVSSASGIYYGMVVTGTGVTAGTYVTAVSGTTLTVSQAVNIASGAAVSFTANGYLATRSLNRYLLDHDSWLNHGVKCDGSTDDSVALQVMFNLYAYGPGGYHLEGPPGAFCVFKKTLNINVGYGDIGGAGGYSTNLVYAGASTTNDLITVGQTARVATSTSVSQNGTTIHDLTVASNTKMTAGSAIHEMGTGFIFYNNIIANSPNLWDGVWFDQTDFTRFTNFLISAQDDCIRVSGNGAEGSTATGPQYDLWVDGGKVTACHAGVHVGGGFDGVSFDHMEDTTVDYNVLVDEGIPDSSGNTHPNQEVWFGSQFVMGFGGWDNVYINDPKCKPSIFCNVSIAGYLTIAGNGTLVSGGGGASVPAGIATGSFSGQTAPANSGNGVHIKSYPGGQVHLMTPYAQGFSNAAVLTEDNSANLYMDPGVDVSFARYGVTSTTAGWAVKSMPFVESMTGVTTPVSNVVTPALTSPYGSVKVGLGTATDAFAQSVVSNGGAEGEEVACGSTLFVSGACRDLTINAAHTAYYVRVYDAASHTFNLSGTATFGIGNSAFNTSGSTAYVVGSFGAGGSSGGYNVLDRTTTGNNGVIYRTGGVNYLFDTAFGGNVASWGTAGFQSLGALGAKGHIYGTGSAPTISASAGTATASTGINDNHGTINQSAAGTVTIKFAAAYTNAPDCLVDAQNGGATTYSTAGGAVGTANLAVTLTAAAKFTYHCQGQ